MSVNSIMHNVMPVQMTVPAFAPNGQLYPQTNSGKIIGGTIGAIAWLSSSNNSGLSKRL